MALTLTPTGIRQRPAGGPSLPVFYPRAGYDSLGALVADLDPIRVTQMPVPNANGPQPTVPGSALHPQPNA